MEQYIPKSALIAEIERIQNEFSDSSDRNENFDDLENQGAYKALDRLESFLDTLEVKDPYEQCVQYPSIKDGIKAHAEIYSFNIESELFNQLTKEQQTLWRKEIEQACISGGEAGVELARDIRYKENLEVKEMDLEAELNKWRHNHFHGRRDKDASGEYLERVSQLGLAKYFFELGMCAANPLTVKDIKKIYHLVNEVSDDLGVRAIYVNIYQEVLKRFNVQKEGRV